MPPAPEADCSSREMHMGSEVQGFKSSLCYARACGFQDGKVCLHLLNSLEKTLETESPKLQVEIEEEIHSGWWIIAEAPET